MNRFHFILHTFIGKNGFLLLLLFTLVFFTTSCLKEDTPVKKPDINATEVQTEFSTYNTQGYYSLKNASFVKTNEKSAWDLRFDCNNSFYIWLNSAKYMMVADAGNISLQSITDTAGLHFTFDYPSGNPDSNAIGEWGDFSTAYPISKNHVYIIDLGRDANGNVLGFKKMRIKNFTSNAYTIEFLDLHSIATTPYTLTITKNSTYNYAYVSLQGLGSIVDIEPPKDQWDLWFTQYTTWIYDPDQGFDISYLVIGVLINPNATSGSYDSLNRFSQIEILEAQSKPYYKNWDIVGYGWKNAGNVTGGGPVVYITYPQITYIIKSQSNEYFKMRFTDFYNNAGTRGYPKWEQLQM